MHARKGLTLIEVLIALAILTLVVLSALHTLLLSTSMTRNTKIRFASNQRAQRALEKIRTEWSDAEKFDKTCVSDALPDDVTIEVFKLSSPTKKISFYENCENAVKDPTPIAFKRVVATAGSVRLILDIARPQQEAEGVGDD